MKKLKDEVDISYKIVEEDKPETTLDQFKEHVEKLNTIQASPKKRKSEFELRATAVPDFEKSIKEIINYADNTLKVYEPENRAQTDEELNKLLADGQALEKELEEKMAAQKSLPPNEEPVFVCGEFSMKIELLKINMKMMKRKVLPPKTTATPTPVITQDATGDASTTSTAAPTTAEATEVPEGHVDL